MDSFTKTLSEADPFSSWLPIIVAIIFGIIMTIRIIMGGQTCPCDNNAAGKIVIVTGGSGGIGLEICKDLCKRSAHVIIGCKDMEKGTNAKGKIIKCQSNASVDVKYLDLKSFDCVRRFVRTIEKDFQHVDVLINNAGIIFNKNEKTTDGYDVHLQVNYLSHFLLTIMLLPLLKRSPQGRIINVAAHAYIGGKMNIDDPLNVRTMNGVHERDAFSHSKLAIILATRYLANKLKDTSVTINVCTPGLVRGTEHLRKSPIMSALCTKIITYPWMWIFMKNASQGAQTIIYLAIDDKLNKITGIYFNDCEKSDFNGMAVDILLGEMLCRETFKAIQIQNNDIF